MHEDFMRQLAADHAGLLRSEAVRARRVRRTRGSLPRNPCPRPAV